MKRRPAVGAVGWLVDQFGNGHPLGERTMVGRRPEADVVILEASVSREHAEVTAGGGRWRVRDLGSRNWTRVDGSRVQGRAPLVDGAQVRFGNASFYFIGRTIELPVAAPPSVDTAHAGDGGAFRYLLRGGDVELCVLGSGDAAGGALLHRGRGARSWEELSLAPLEFQLLRVLCARALEDGGSPLRSRGCVPTRQLARLLPFQSRYANEENVRQVVRRVRATLSGVDVEGLIEARPGRGYHLSWDVALQ